jgi:hypothetical protein
MRGIVAAGVVVLLSLVGCGPGGAASSSSPAFAAAACRDINT